MVRILLVEDDPNVRMLMEDFLIDSGYEVDGAATMESGSELLSNRPYDLVIADGRLPDGTGIEIADEALEKGAKALVISAYAVELRQEPHGCYEVLLKPVNPPDLLEAIERALAKLPPKS
jgi:two-component system, NtrC family, response regulator HydG